MDGSLLSFVLLVVWMDGMEMTFVPARSKAGPCWGTGLKQGTS